MLAIRFNWALPVFKAEHVRGFDED